MKPESWVNLHASKADHAGRLLLHVVEQLKNTGAVKLEPKSVYLQEFDWLEEVGNALLAIGNDTDVIVGVPDPLPSCHSDGESQNMTPQLREGAYYRDSDGCKVGPMRKDFSFGNIWDCRECFPDDNKYHWFADGRRGYGATEDCPDLVAEWTDEPQDKPTLWRDMTPEQKGALLLAHHEGKKIEWKNPDPNSQLWDEWKPCLSAVGKHGHYAYRVKPPEPKRGTVVLHACKVDGWSAVRSTSRMDTHRITFDLIDGKPDCASIRMEEL